MMPPGSMMPGMGMGGGMPGMMQGNMPPGMGGVTNTFSQAGSQYHTPSAGLPVHFADHEQRSAIKFHGQRSHPVMAEDAHMGWEPNVTYYEEGSKDKHPLDPSAGLSRTIVKLPHPRFQGGPEFIDGVPKRNTTFAWTELCATREPECSMAPVPQVAQKSWYNSYVYVPEQRSHVERQYLERFVPGPDGEWVDVVKARRMTSFLEEQRMKALQSQEEQRQVAHGDVVELTDYVDQYTGEHLVSCNNQLMSKAEVFQRYNIHKSDWGQQVDSVPAFDFDNLRVPWLFGKVDRNKKVSQGVYDYFDRRNPSVVSDRSYKIMELPSYYVDQDQYNKWRAYGHDGITGVAEDMAVRARYLDDYPYKM